MGKALESNPSLAAARSQVRGIREELPLAWSEAFPQISGSAAAVQLRRNEDLPAVGIRNHREHWIATLNTSTLVFGSGRVLHSTRQARGRIAAAGGAYQDLAQSLLVDVTRAYAEVVAARQSKAAQDQSLANLEKQLQYVSANVREGFLTQTDLAQARARREQARAGLAQADLLVVQASEAYLRLVGHIPGELDPVPTLEGLPRNVDDAVAIALKDSPAVLSSAGSLDAAEAAVGVARASGRWRVSLDTQNSFFELLDAHNTIDATEDSVALRLSVPLYSGGAISARTRQQRAGVSAARLELSNTQREVRERVTVAWYRVDATSVTLNASRMRLEAAELAQQGTQREQRAGLRSVIDVLNQEEELLSARVDVYRAERDHTVAQRELAANIGRLATMESLDTNPRREIQTLQRGGSARPQASLALAPMPQRRAAIDVKPNVPEAAQTAPTPAATRFAMSFQSGSQSHCSR